MTSGIEDRVDPNTNFDGRYVVFNSSDEFLPNPDPNFKSSVFLYDQNTGMIRQLTFGVDTDYPTINNDGSRIVFQQDYDHTNELRDVMLYDLLTDTTTKISNSLGTSEIPVISDVGKLIVFLSTSDFTGGNPDGSYEIFLAREVERVPLPGTLLLIALLYRLWNF